MYRHPKSPHTFHIPVMGTGFTISTPLSVAKYGISSVISLVDDVLIEQMRKHYSDKFSEPYEPIGDRDGDARARRITAYLDLINRQVKKQIEELKKSPFEEGSEITRYFRLLPDSPLKHTYQSMLASKGPSERARLETILRESVIPGEIDVNVMTKLDRDSYNNGERLDPENSDALSALRGFANSTLDSSIVCSAGMNQRFYSYFSNFEDFYPDSQKKLRKRIILKVSDYRSAVIQGKFLAKKGLWVSEYRIESGLDCGGHAFATQGHLLGPILKEFKEKKQELTENLHKYYEEALNNQDRQSVDEPMELKITVQGGIGTHEEDKFLLKYFNVEGTGWGTPFLLVPETVNLDLESMEKLCLAGEEDVYLSDSSPMGIPFWNLRTSASEEARRRRIAEGRPGSACPKGFIAFNNEFTDIPICTASRSYQKMKLSQIEKNGFDPVKKETLKEQVLVKSCICHDLGGGATKPFGIDNNATPAVCCGPNIVNFSRIATLEEIVDHIYGRFSLITNSDRPHMFVKELKIYTDYLKNEIEKYSLALSTKTPKYFHEFKENLLSGIEEYRKIAENLIEEHRIKFLSDLKKLQEEIETIPQVAPSV